MNACTYHLDQNVRDAISKGRMSQQFLKKYQFEKHEAILPFALLEYARISIRKIFSTMPKIPDSLLYAVPIEIKKIKEYFEKHIRKNATEEYVNKKLEQQLQYDNEYAHPFIRECITILPEVYDIIIAQLSWDRFAQMEWSKRIRNKRLLSEIRVEIAKLACKGHLYTLRHCHYMNQIFYTNIDDKPDEVCKYINIMKRVKLKSNMDIGDCELIHTAINGQSSSNLKERKIVDCYTMDPSKEIKNRLILCLFYYEMLEKEPIQYKFKFQHCGKIYIINNNGIEKEIINVKDYLPNKIIHKIKENNPEILSLLDN